jgi:hypothetical protein
MLGGVGGAPEQSGPLSRSTLFVLTFDSSENPMNFVVESRFNDDPVKI